MILRFSTGNYRNLILSDTLSFGAINLFVGPNNSGKSNLISSMTVLIDLLAQGFEKTIRRRRYRSILNRLDRAKEDETVRFSWVFNTDQGFADLEYSLVVDIPRHNYIEHTAIASEKLSYSKPRKGQKHPFNWISCHDRERGRCSFPVKKKGLTSSLVIEANARESVFNQLDQLLKRQQFTQDVYPLFHPTVESVRSYVDTWKYYSISEMSTANLKGYARLRGEELYVSATGDNLGNILRVIFPRYPAYKLEFTKLVQQFVPSLEAIEYEIIGDRDVNLFALIQGERFDFHELSDGTVRLLFLLFVLTSPVKPKVLFIDEPELNLHPAWQRNLVQHFLRASQQMQLFVSTHSPELLDGFTRSFRAGESDLFVFDCHGNIRPQTGNDVLEEQFEQGWELGDLYRVGDPLIGGWP